MGPSGEGKTLLGRGMPVVLKLAKVGERPERDWARYAQLLAEEQERAHAGDGDLTPYGLFY